MSILMNMIEEGFRVDSFDPKDLEKVEKFIGHHQLGDTVRIVRISPIHGRSCAFHCTSSGSNTTAEELYRAVALWIILSGEAGLINKGKNGLYLGRVPCL